MVRPRREGFRSRHRNLRVLILLGVLLVVSVWRMGVLSEEREPVDWTYRHDVLLCPLVGPGTEPQAVAELLSGADVELDAWFAEEFEHWTGRAASPLRFTVAAPVAAGDLPPPLPEVGDGLLARWRATHAFLSYFRSREELFPPRGTDGSAIFLLVTPPGRDGGLGDRDGVGTRRGRFGVVAVSDDPAARGNALCVIVHETLHSLGALDRRGPGLDIAFPDGYAEPDRSPLHPQDLAEAMALGIPLSPAAEARVTDLSELVIGAVTASEIGWLPPPEAP